MGATVCKLRLLGGITAAGKTDWAIAWAKKNNAEILSCDSVSCYRGLNIGSAKPGPDEIKQVKHHGIDLVDPDEVFDVGRYHEYARQVLTQSVEQSVPMLVVGGSGFFLEGFLKPVVDGMNVPPSIREKVDQWYETEGLVGCVKRLKEMNPSGLGDLDQNNQARVRRALERCLSSGKELAEIKREFDSLPKPYPTFSKEMIWLDRENEDIEARIQKRTEHMLSSGMIDETRDALSKGMNLHPSLSKAVGYREVGWFLEGKLNREELKQAITSATRKLVSKQRKWFRNRFPPKSRFLLNQKQEVNPEELNWVSDS